ERPDLAGAATGNPQRADRVRAVHRSGGSGSIKSLAQPGGNAPGFLQFEFDLSAKWLELLKEVAPQITRVGVFRTFVTSGSAGQWAVIQAFSRAAGVECLMLPTSSAAQRILRASQTAA